MISESVWNLGGSSTYNDVIAKTFYERERGTTVYSGRPTKWIGKVGLMYPSDYGYATSGGATTDRNTCLNTVLHNWNGSGVSDCKNNDWLLGSSAQWTITSPSLVNFHTFLVETSGRVDYLSVAVNSNLYPSIYLNPNIVIENESDGSSTNPFILN